MDKDKAGMKVRTYIKAVSSDGPSLLQALETAPPRRPHQEGQTHRSLIPLYSHFIQSTYGGV